MESIVLQTYKWSVSPPVYLYLDLGGLAGGILLLSIVADFFAGRSPRAKALAEVASYLGLPVIAAAGFFLTVHLGKPERGILFPLFFTNYSSWMTIGGWIVATYVLGCVAVAALWFFRGPRWMRVTVGALGIPPSLTIALYTGMLLSGSGFTSLWRGTETIPLWDRNYLPLMFLASGVTSGIAAAALGVILARGVGWPRSVRDLSPEAYRGLVWSLCIPLGVMILLEAFELSRFLRHLETGTLGQKMAYAFLTEEAALWFWGGVFGLGLGLPLLGALISLVTRRTRLYLTLPTFGAVLVGALILRFVIVWGGELKQPLLFPPQKWPIPTAASPGSAEALKEALIQTHRR